MKPYIIIFCLMLLSASAMAADLTFQWDKWATGATWDKIRIYEVTTGTSVKVGEVLGNVTTFELKGVDISKQRSYIARSYNAAVNVESANSNVVQTPALPSAPGGLKITVQVTLTGGQ